jgi:phage tail-like protein
VPAEPSLLNDVEPIASFRFGISVEDSPELVGIFTECKLPDVEWDVQQVKEGGRNDFIHQLPGQRKPSKVTLKHGLTKQFVLIDWYSEMMSENYEGFLKTVTITLLDGQGKAMLRWNLHNAYPVKVTWPELKAGDNAVAIQTLELACGLVEFEKDPAA